MKNSLKVIFGVIIFLLILLGAWIMVRPAPEFFDCQDLLDDKIPPAIEHEFFTYMPGDYTEVQKTYEATGYTCQIVSCTDQTGTIDEVIECIR